MTIPGFDGDVSVDDRASECLTAIARTYEEGLAHLEFLARLWSEPAERAVPALPVMTPIADEPAAPLLAEEPAMLPLPVVAAEVPADAPTVVELPVVVLPEPALAESSGESPARADVADEAGEPGSEDARVLLFAEAATAEIPVQAAA